MLLNKKIKLIIFSLFLFADSLNAKKHKSYLKHIPKINSNIKPYVKPQIGIGLLPYPSWDLGVDFETGQTAITIPQKIKPAFVLDVEGGLLFNKKKKDNAFPTLSKMTTDLQDSKKSQSKNSLANYICSGILLDFQAIYGTTHRSANTVNSDNTYFTSISGENDVISEAMLEDSLAKQHFTKQLYSSNITFNFNKTKKTALFATLDYSYHKDSYFTRLTKRGDASTISLINEKLKTDYFGIGIGEKFHLPIKNALKIQSALGVYLYYAHTNYDAKEDIQDPQTNTTPINSTINQIAPRIKFDFETLYKIKGYNVFLNLCLDYWGYSPATEHGTLLGQQSKPTKKTILNTLITLGTETSF